MAAYALTVGRGGPKLTRSIDQDGDSDQTGLEWSSERRVLRVTSSNMDEFMLTMQMLMDKPAVNQTGLAGKWDFLLKWRPDDSPTTDANTLTGIFTAMQDQLGLKLESVKIPVDVIVIDHIERPSAN